MTPRRVPARNRSPRADTFPARGRYHQGPQGIAPAALARSLPRRRAPTPSSPRPSVSQDLGEILVASGALQESDLQRARAHQRNGGVALEEALAASSAFEEALEVSVPGSMEAAVDAARDFSAGEVPVLLSPGCASFDWYGSYGERGDDFARIVREREVGA